MLVFSYWILLFVVTEHENGNNDVIVLTNLLLSVNKPVAKC